MSTYLRIQTAATIGIVITIILTYVGLESHIVALWGVMLAIFALCIIITPLLTIIKMVTGRGVGAVGVGESDPGGV